MRVWRICKERRVVDAFNGAGAEKYGGRWNHKGDRVVYASTTLSLAALELFVHLQPDCMPNDLFSVEATLPGRVSVEELTIGDLPANWRDYPSPTSLQDIGANWLRGTRSLLLIVPSAVNPEEKNLLFNPLHPEHIALTRITVKPFQFDPRMWKNV